MSTTATQSERALLGAILQEHDRIYPVVQMEGITMASFTDDDCIRAWTAIEGLRNKGKIVDLVTVAEAMGGDTEGNWLTLGEMVEACPTTVHAEHYAREVREAERRRELHTGARLALEALARGESTEEVAEFFRAAGEGVQCVVGGPQIVSASEFAAVERMEPIQVVHGALRAGQVGILSASSKAGKSWALLAAGFAVATGDRWFGWNTAQGRVLYINAELPDYDLESRLILLGEALGLDDLPEGLDVLHLRGRPMTIPQLLPAILRRQRDYGPYALIMPDPLYRFGQGRDENDNAVQALTMGELGELAEKTAAAVLAAHHFSKGNQSTRDHMDRASGAGMFARAPDLIATLTSHEEMDCYTLEATCRSFAKPDPVVVRWQYPLWTVADELDPERLKRALGRPAKYSIDDLLDLLPPEGLTHGDWFKKAKQDIGIGKTRFNELVRMAKGEGKVVSAFGNYVRGGGP